MTDPTRDEIPELVGRRPPIRPLDPDADRRVRARMLAAYQAPPLADVSDPAEPLDDDDDDDVEVVLEAPARSSLSPRGGLRGRTRLVAAAVVAVALVGAVVLALDEPDPPSTSTGPSADAPPTSAGAGAGTNWLPELAPGARWEFTVDQSFGASGSSVGRTVVRVDELGATGATVTVRTDVGGRAVLGRAELSTGATGAVGLPPILLDPTADLVDCADETALLLTGGGEVARQPDCDGRIEVIAVSVGDAAPATVVGAEVESTPVTVRWRLAGGPERTTTIQLTPGFGVTAIDTTDPISDRTTTYRLEEFSP